MLACAIMGNSVIARERVVITRLPTLTPTPSGVSTPLPDSGLAPIEDLAPVATPVVEPTPILVDIPLTNFTSETPGWMLTGSRIYSDQTENSVLLYGDIVNETGSVQEVTLVTGAFFDPQGQLIAGTGGGRGLLAGSDYPGREPVPFELIVPGMQNIAKVNLRIEAQPSSETPRQDFEFADLHETNENNNYCVGGTYRSQGGELQQYLVIVLVLYNNQDNLINFADYSADPSAIVTDPPESLKCVLRPSIRLSLVTNYEPGDSEIFCHTLPPRCLIWQRFLKKRRALPPIIRAASSAEKPCSSRT